MAGGRWYFTKEQLENTPSRKCGIDSDKELSYRQQAANFIQDMGQRLQVSQLCINTAIVYMHRFYLFHSFTKFHRNAISTCSLFLAAKVEEQPRKLEHVIKVAHLCLHRENTPFDVKSDAYMEQSHELIANENIMLQTLGFDIGIDHPHTYVVKCCQLVRASKDLAQTSYIMATNSLHLTTMSLQYPPTVVACVCIHLACKWSDWELPASNEGKEWYWYVDQTVTKPLLEELTTEFLVILEKAPSRLKRKLSGGGKESEVREKRKLEVTIASPNSGIRSHEKESQPCEKRMKTEISVTSSSNEKVHVHQEDKRLITANRCPKSVPSPVATSKEIQPHHSKSSAVHNLPQPSLAKLPVSTAEEPSPSKRVKEGSHSITIADYKEMKEKQEQKIKGQNKVSNYNPQSHSVQSSSKKPVKEERKPDFHQNTNERGRQKHHKTTHPPKHTEDNVTNEQQPAELTNMTEENLQQKAIDDIRHTSSSRAVNSNRAEPMLSSTWYDKGKSESYHLKQKELPAEMPIHSHSHQAKTSARPLAVQETLVSQHSDQDLRQRHGSELPSERAQTNSISGENVSQTKASKTKHLKHKLVPPVMTASLPQDDLSGHERSAKKIAEGENLSNSKSADLTIAHKLESEHSKRSDSSVDKVSDSIPRQDRREKHKHKHSSHSSERDKTSSSAEHGSSSVSGGLKITIPKEKIVSSTQRTNSSNSPRDPLKIKINKAKITSNDTSTSKSSSSANRNLKLVIAKDKKQRNSYSCTSYTYSPQKPDCDGQKREASPTSASVGTSSEQLNVNRSPKVKYDHTASARRSAATHSSNDESQIPLPPETNPVQHSNVISHNQQIMAGTMPMSSYHQPKPPHQAYVAYSQPQYFPQYFQCPPVHLNANTTRLPQMFSNPRIPPPYLSDEPPLPKEPPPLPPPLPPE